MDNDVWINSETGAAYDNLLAARWYDEFVFCGCGIPETVLEYVRDILEAMAVRSDSGWKTNAVEETVKGSPDAAYYFVMYALDAMGLTEHGGEVSGSWLTEKGRTLLAELKTGPIDLD